MHEIHAKRGALAWLLLLAALTTGCEEWWGEDEEDPELDASMNPSVTDAAAEAGPGPVDAGLPDAAPSVDSSVVTADAAVDASVPDAAPVVDAAPALDASVPDAAPDPAADAAPEAAAPGTELPCDVAQVLKTRCQGCHGQPLAGGPMPLITLADLHGTWMNAPVYQRVQVRIDSTTMPMPPTWGSTGALTPAEKATLTNWISAGAPGSNNVCP